MRRIALLIGLILMARCAVAQTYGRMDFQLQTAQGQAIAGATVQVFTQSACGVATTGTLATLYPTATGGTPLTQPLRTNGFGAAFAYALQGCYTVVYQSQYTGTQTFIDQNSLAASNLGSGTISGTLTAGKYPIATGAHTLTDGIIRNNSNLLFVDAQSSINGMDVEAGDGGITLNVPGSTGPVTIYTHDTYQSGGKNATFIADSGPAIIATNTNSQPIELNSKIAGYVDANADLGLVLGYHPGLGTSTAGSLFFRQGTNIATPPVANSIELSAPTSVTAYGLILPGAAPTNFTNHMQCTNATPAVCTWVSDNFQGVTGSIGGGALTNSCATGTALVAGATTSMVAFANASTSGVPGAFSVGAQVTTNGTVTVSVCGTGTPTASTYLVSVIP